MSVDLTPEMTFDELLANSDDPTLYSALQSTIMKDIGVGLDLSLDNNLSGLIKTITDSPTQDNSTLVALITQMFDTHTTNIESIVQSDLDAQVATRQLNTNVASAGALLPDLNTQPSDLVIRIATPGLLNVINNP